MALKIYGDIEGATISDNEWHHIALTVDYTNNLAKAFTDGVRNSSIAWTYAAVTEVDPVYIGSNGGSELNGAVAFPRIYQRVLAEDEVFQLHESGKRMILGL